MVTLHFGVVGGEQPDEEIVEIDEFIVYAQKKPEKIQEVPISLSAYALMISKIGRYVRVEM